MIKSEENLEDIGDLNKERIKIDMNMLLKNLDNYSSSFSYLPYLKRMLNRKKFKFKPSKSLYKTLVKLNNELRNNPKLISKRIIKKLQKKEETLLFGDCLRFLVEFQFKNINYFWYPNVKVTNVFCLIKLILPNFIEKYKKHIIEGNDLNDNVLRFIKDKYPESIDQFKGIESDHIRFQKSVNNETYSSMLITPPFWINNYEEYFEGKDKLEVNGDLECILVEEVSFVDVSYKEKIYKIPYSVYMGCLTNNNDSVEYLEKIILKK